MTEPDSRPVAVPLWALDRLLSHFAADGWSRTDKPELGEAWDVLIAAKDAALGYPVPAAAQAPPLPPGRWGRVELPGYRQHTGWITEETRFGVQMAIVRNFDGIEEAAVAVGPGSRVVFLPTPLRRPDAELAALPAADGYEGYYPEADEDDEPADAFAGHRGPDETAMF